MVDDVFKQFSATRVLHDQIELFGGLDDLVELNDVRVPNQLQDVDFSCHSLDVSDLRNLVLLQDFDRDFFPSENVDTQLDFTEGSLSKGFA